MRLSYTLPFCAFHLFLSVSAVRSEDAWGVVKGQVVWGGDKFPERKPINVTQDRTECLKNGPLLERTYEVDKDSGGVRWVIAWLTDAREPRNVDARIPIHPGLKKLKDTPLTLELDCCTFHPYVFGVIEGQTVVIKNDCKVPHNPKIDGGGNNPMIGQLVPPGTRIKLPGWKATGPGAVPISCSIHPWMICWARVFNHPYFAVTDDKGRFEIKDAPAGDFRLIVWHPEKGWLAKRDGLPITIKAGEATDLGKIKLVPDTK
jgi:hypothetical protein